MGKKFEEMAANEANQRALQKSRAEQDAAIGNSQLLRSKMFNDDGRYDYSRLGSRQTPMQGSGSSGSSGLDALRASYTMDRPNTAAERGQRRYGTPEARANFDSIVNRTQNWVNAQNAKRRAQGGANRNKAGQTIPNRQAEVSNTNSAAPAKGTVAQGQIK